MLHLEGFLGILDTLWFKRSLDVIFFCELFDALTLLFLEDLHLQLSVQVLSLANILFPELIFGILLASFLLEQILFLKGLLKISAFAPFNVDVEANLGYLISRLDVLLPQKCLLFSNHFVHSYGAHAGVEHLAYLRSIISFFHPVLLLSVEGRNDFLARLFLID